MFPNLSEQVFGTFKNRTDYICYIVLSVIVMFD